MKKVSDIIKSFCRLRIQLLYDTKVGSTCIYQRSIYMPMSAIGVMACERERASMYLPVGFRLRTSVSTFTDEDVRLFSRSFAALVYECTSDFRHIFKEIHHTAVHYIDV